MTNSPPFIFLVYITKGTHFLTIMGGIHPFALPTLHALSTYPFVICSRKSERMLRPDFCYSLITSKRQRIKTFAYRNCKMRGVNVRKNHSSYVVTANVNMANVGYGLGRPRRTWEDNIKMDLQ